MDKEEKNYLQYQLLEMAQYYKDRGIAFFCVRYPSLEEIFGTCVIEGLDYKKQLLHGSENEMTDEDQERFYGNLYSPSIADDMINTRNKLSSHIRNGIFRLDDFESDFINVKDGHRLVPNAPKKSVHKVYLIGKCNFFGFYQDDYHTIGYYLQEQLIQDFNGNYEVVIASNLGMNEFSALYCEKVRTEDIVVCCPAIVVMEDIDNTQILNTIYINEAFESVSDIQGYLFNNNYHHNHVINKKVAKILYKGIKGFAKTSTVVDEPRVAKQDYYIAAEVDRCYRELKAKADRKAPHFRGKIGGIVMNCNPFTLGHRYLVEESLKRVDFLYIFVVEEDKSFFRFKDRFKLVQNGVEDLGKKVCILPSGRFVASSETFAQYFDRDHEIDFVEDMDYDLRIFGEVVCRYFGISIRFVGEEPFDKVTAKYNETMKRILPEYGVEVIEIPRVKTEDGTLVSATQVRSLLSDCVEGLRKLVPENEIPDVFMSYYLAGEPISAMSLAHDNNRLVALHGGADISENKIFILLHQFCDDPDCHVYIWGAGRWGKSLLNYLEDNNEPVRGFVVDDEYVSEARVDVNSMVIGHSELNRKKDKVIIATSRTEVYDQLYDWGGAYVELPEWFLREISGTVKD